MKRIALFLYITIGMIPALASGQDRDQRIAHLERKLTETKSRGTALRVPG